MERQPTANRQSPDREPNGELHGRMDDYLAAEVGATSVGYSQSSRQFGLAKQLRQARPGVDRSDLWRQQSRATNSSQNRRLAEELQPRQWQRGPDTRLVRSEQFL
ncbi:hypothetical protein V6N13_038023 [Hibiscus sabdariffa]|uniref:Uncharacterized protein n=1 Tax=Hibiscus sabdariffa TaxID=183260 RepID=A0ABR2S3T9_9ROSI